MVGERNGEVGLGLGRLVPHAEREEGFLGALGQGGAFLNEIQLQIHLGLIEIAESQAIGVVQVGSSRAAAR